MKAARGFMLLFGWAAATGWRAGRGGAGVLPGGIGVGCEVAEAGGVPTTWVGAGPATRVGSPVGGAAISLVWQFSHTCAWML